MKRIFLACCILLLAVGCANTPYTHKDKNTGLGYWSKKIADGVYEVYFSYNSSTDERRADDYIWIHGYEVCAKDKYYYYYMGEERNLEGYENKTKMSYAFCLKEAVRYGLGIQLDDDSLKIINIASKQTELGLKVDDVVLSINGKSVTRLDEIHLILHSNSSKQLKVEILRNGKKMTKSITPKVMTGVYSKLDVAKWMKKYGISPEQLR